MKQGEKIFFWILTVVIIVDNIFWQWWIKLTTEPVIQPIGGVLGSMIGDIILLGVWLYLLIKLYRKATHKD